jgi:hypothetical protein
MVHPRFPSFYVLEEVMSDPVTLRVKIKSLAAEARIISREERRALRHLLRLAPDAPARPDAQTTYVSLRAHRREVVGRAAREALLAYGFLRGRAYARLEPSNSSSPDWDGIRKVAERFAAPADRTVFPGRWDEWKAAAEAYRAV